MTSYADAYLRGHGDKIESAQPFTAPETCPTCRSSSILTTSKTPDAESYWRCVRCGDVWNDSRRRALSGASRR